MRRIALLVPAIFIFFSVSLPAGAQDLMDPLAPVDQRARNLDPPPVTIQRFTGPQQKGNSGDPDVFSAAPEFDFQAQLDAVGADELLDNLPDDARALLDESGIDNMDYQQLLGLSPKGFFKTVWDLVLTRIRQPLSLFGSILGIIILCVLLDILKTTLWEGTLSTVFSAVAILCVATAIAVPIIDCIHETASSIHACSNFILTFIPVFGSIITVSGQPVTATTYTAFLFAACQVISQIASSILVPLMKIYLAFCLVGSLSSEINVTAVANAIKAAVNWALGLLLTLFVGLLSLQTMVSSGSDGIAAKTAKFLIGTFVPVAGSAISEAFIATQGYMKLLKTTVGVFGIVVALMTFLPILLQTVIWYLTVNLSASVSEMLQIKHLASILKSCSATLGVLISMILCFALLIIISTSLILIVYTGG
jgi:stage III sporulation protein AE